MQYFVSNPISNTVKLLEKLNQLELAGILFTDIKIVKDNGNMYVIIYRHTTNLHI